MFKKYSHENWGLRPVVVLDLEVGEEDDGGVGGEEDEDVPGAVQVGEAHTGPPVVNVQSGYWQDQHHNALTKVKSSANNKKVNLITHSHEEISSQRFTKGNQPQLPQTKP